MYLRFAIAVAIVGASLCVSAQVKPAAPYKAKPSNEFKVKNDRPSQGVGAAPAKAPSEGKELEQIEKEHPAKSASHAPKQSASLDKPDKPDTGKTPKSAINFKPTKAKRTPPPRPAANPYKGRLRDKGSQP